MTALTVPCTAPTPFERMLLAVSSRLADVATMRMRRRAASLGRHALRVDAAEAQRDLAATVRAGMLPR